MKRLSQTIGWRAGLVGLVWIGSAFAGPSLGLKDEGVGMYTDASVANQVSTFTLTRALISCGVGTVNAGGDFGPFEMLMFSLSIDSYAVKRDVPRTITATGKMRSITRVAGQIVEDTDGTGLNPPPHDYIAIGQDKDSPQADRFDIHVATPFWNTGNPLCTPSAIVAGGCRFGGAVFLGNVVVSSSKQF
ncbi:hypothetical protein [Nitrospira sp. Kam-Ns4a]